MYKAAYGDLKVPQRFIVPSMKPWPKAAWGMRLGKIVMHMRSTGKYSTENPERRKQLDEMGFVWQLRSPDKPKVTLSQVYTALEVYARVYGNLNVERSFVVPNTEEWPDSVHEMPLGKSLLSLPKLLQKKTNTQWKERFTSLGWQVPKVDSSSTAPPPAPASATAQPLEISSSPDAATPSEKLSANDERFRKVLSAMTTYRKIYGDLLIPQPFVVPENDSQWPEDTWGLRLGARVNAIRSQGTFVNGNPERRAQLDELGFVWSPPKEGGRGRRKAAETTTTSTATTTEKSNQADLDLTLEGLLDSNSVDFDFELGDKGAAPKPTWAFEGGGDLQDLARPPMEEKNDDEYLPPRTLQESLDEAVARAKDVGIIEGLTESRRVIKGKQEKNIPWFNDDFGDDFVYEDVVEALTLYKSFYGDFSNLTQAVDYVIPTKVERTGFLDDDDDSLTTFDIDASARAARAIAKFEEEGETDKSEDLIAAEIERLQKEVGTLTEELETDVERETTKIDDSRVEWPEHLGGMKLGNIVARIRDGSLEVKHLPERKKQLDDIDFDWGDDHQFIDVPFEKAMCAMYAYYMIRGDLFVYEDFVMPDEDPWPQALAGYEIGKAVKRLRELQNFMEAYHPEKVSLLRMIDFIWFPTTALPIDPDEPEMDDELLRLSALGHPDYAKMIDIPMGLPDKIIADGPFYESDNPKHWWRIWHNWDYVKDYWYEQGRRDNAYVLRKSGYPRMAAEHEAKYGPGLFQQIEETLAVIAGGLESKSVTEKSEIVAQLKFYGQEMQDCTDVHPEERDRLLEEFEQHINALMEDPDVREAVEEENGPDETEGTAEDDDYDDDEDDFEEYESDETEDTTDDDEDDFEEYEEEFDVEDELGLDAL